ncbi:hypothetical protein Tco_1346091 [Tanacetum coccineum]
MEMLQDREDLMEAIQAFLKNDVNLIYDEVLEDIDGTNYLIDSIIDLSPKIDHLLEEFAGGIRSYQFNSNKQGVAGATSLIQREIFVLLRIIVNDFFISAVEGSQCQRNDVLMVVCSCGKFGCDLFRWWFKGSGELNVGSGQLVPLFVIWYEYSLWGCQSLGTDPMKVGRFREESHSKELTYLLMSDFGGFRLL